MNLKKIQNFKKNRKQKEWMFTIFFCCLLCLSCCMQVNATAQVTGGITKLRDLVASIISAIGSIIVLWGIFEMGNAMQGGNGMEQSMSFKRISGGVIMTIAPQLLTILVSNV